MFPLTPLVACWRYEPREHPRPLALARPAIPPSALDQAAADRDIARLNLGYTEIRAPIDGFVGNRSARAGAYATVGGQLLAIVPVSALWVDANFKESQLARVREGQPAEVIADVLPGVTLRGRVASLAPATGAQFSVIPPENATGNFTKVVQRVPVRIRLEDDAAEFGRLRPGLSVVVHVDGRPKVIAFQAHVCRPRAATVWRLWRPLFSTRSEMKRFGTIKSV